MTPTDIWSQQAWNAADHIYKEIIRHPFVLQLADGTLPREVFERYIGQDSLYLGVYCRVLSHLASRLPQADMTEAFLGFAQDGVAVEKALHSLYINERPIEMSPSCLLYTSTLMAQAYETVEVEAAAILPCFWVYLKVGQHIAATMKPDNPYSDWIATYSDPPLPNQPGAHRNLRPPRRKHRPRNPSAHDRNIPAMRPPGMALLAQRLHRPPPPRLTPTHSLPNLLVTHPPRPTSHLSSSAHPPFTASPAFHGLY